MKNLICFSGRSKELMVVCLVGLFLILNVKSLSAQDIHYTQFYNSPLNINPAKTGVFNGDQRITASYRDQWRSVPVPWTTFTLSYDQKIYLKNNRKQFFSGGVFLNYDRQGTASINLTNLNLAGSYTRLLTPNNLLTFGLSVGFATRGFDTGSLTWDNQWDGEIFNPSTGSGELFDNQRVNFIENSVGLNYRWQKSDRTKIDIGLGAFHFIEPSVNFQETNAVNLPRRFSLTGIGSVKLTSKLDLQLHAMGQQQNEFDEVVFGGLVKLYVNQDRGKEFQLHLGLNYRTSNSLIPVIAIQTRNIYASFSYDIDLSEFNQHTNRRGGPELHFNYIITHVKPLKKFKVCPIY